MSSQEARKTDRDNAVRYMLADRRGRMFLHMLADESGIYDNHFTSDTVCAGHV